MTDQPEVYAIPTRYVVSALPEGHEDHWTYSLQVDYRGRGLYMVRRTLRFADTFGDWDYEPDVESDGHGKWLAERSFDLDAALTLARRLASTLTYRGRSAADVLAEAVQS